MKNFTQLITKSISRLWLVLLLLMASNGFSQVTVTGDASSGSPYANLNAAITAINAVGTLTQNTVITVAASTPQTAPAGGYAITATGSASFSLTIDGSSNTVTAFTPQTAGSKNDAFFKIIGGDYITIRNFTMNENTGNTVATLASNTMTEWGVALFASSTTDGAQNNTIKDNVINLNTSATKYQNAIGVFSSSASSVTNAVQAAASTAGTNSNNKIYGNTITGVAQGVYFVSPAQTSTILETGNDIGGSSLATGNTITFGYTVTAGDLGYTSYSGATAAGIYFRNVVGNSARYNTITNSLQAQTLPMGGIFSANGTTISSGTYTTTFSNNTITITTTSTAAVTGIDFAGGISTGTIAASNNTITINQNAGAAVAAALIGIKANYVSATNTLNSNTITFNQNQSAAATTSALTAITAAGIGTTVTVQSNILTVKQNAPTGAGSYGAGAITYIDVSAGSGTVNVSSNQLLTTGSTIRSTGAVVGVSHLSTITVGITINSNTITIDRVAASGSIAGTNETTAPSTVAHTITNNSITFTNLSGTSTANGIATLGGVSTTGTTKAINGNTISISGTNTGTVIGIQTGYSLGTINSNSITVSTASPTIVGVQATSTSTGAYTMTLNTLSLTSSTTSPTSMIGINTGSTGPFQIYSNTFTALNFTGIITGAPVVSGIAIAAGTGNNVYSNHITNISVGAATSTANPTIDGLLISGGVSTNVYQNKIQGISTLSTGATGVVNGIRISGGTTNQIYNNLIGNLTASASTNPDAIRGISITSTATTTHKVYNNTVYLTGSGGANFGGSGVFHTVSGTATTSALDLRNNIIINNLTRNGTGLAVAFRRSAGAAANLANYASTSNNNLFFAGTPGASNLIYSDGTSTAQTMAAYKAGVFTAGTIAPRDAASFSETSWPAGNFVSVTGSSANYLQPAASLITQAENGGSNIALTSPDYNGVSRGPTYDVGAWQFNGLSPAPVNTVNTPSNACIATSHLITVSATTPSGTMSSATITFNNGTLNSNVAMTLTSGGGTATESFSYTIPTASPSNTVVTWSVTTTNSLGITTITTGTSYQDDPLNGLTAVASASPNPVCSGSPTTLTASLVRPNVSLALGSGSSTSSGGGSPFYHAWGGSKTQYIILASELTALGFAPGNFTSFSLNVTSLGTASLGGFAVNMANTTAAVASTTTLSASYTQVYAGTGVGNAYTILSGTNTFAFGTGSGSSSTFNWDGTSNIVVQFCWSNANTGGTSSTVTSDILASALGMYIYADSQTASAMCSATTGPVGGSGGALTTTIRPRFTFTGVGVVTGSAFSWSPGGATTNPATANPTAPTSYTCGITYLGCVATTSAAAVTIGTVLSGVKSIPGDYPTLTAAVADYNTNCASGNLVFELGTTYTSAGETFPIIIRQGQTASASNTLTIRPAAGATPTISSASASGNIILLGADYVTIDGSNNGTTSKDLTITCTNVAVFNAPIWIGSASATNGATNNTIKNCNLSGQNNANTVACIIAGSGSIMGNPAEVANTNLTIQNNLFTRAQNGFYFQDNLATPATGLVVTGNSMGSLTVNADRLGFRGAAIVNANNPTFSNNTVAGVISAFSFCQGLIVSGNIIGGNITNNKIFSIQNSNAAPTFPIFGIGLYSTNTASNLNVHNNTIYDVFGNGSATLANNGYGIYVSSGGGYNIRFNSINMGSNQTLAASYTAAINVTSGVTTASSIDIRNNVLVNSSNTTSGKYAIYSGAANTVFSNINYNDYYVTGAPSASLGLGFIGSSRQNLAGMIAGFGGNANSINADPLFSTPTLLAPSAGSPLLAAGQTIGGITTDIIGGTRGTPPSIGAYESVYIAPTASFTLNTPVNCSGSSSHNITVTGTAGTAALASGYLGYTVNGGATTVLSLTQSGNDFTGTIPANGTAVIAYTYYVIDANGINSTPAIGSYQDNPLLGVSAVVTSSATLPLCAGSSTNLTAKLIAPGTATLGTGTTTSTNTAESFFPGFWGGAKTQYLITKAELTAMNIEAGPITSLAYYPTSSGQTYQGFQVWMGTTTQTAMTTTFVSMAGQTQVYLATGTDNGYTPTANTLNTLAFGTGGASSSFTWDGTSNLILTFSWSRVPAAATSTASSMRVYSPGFTCSAYEQSDNLTPAAQLAMVTGDGTGTSRPLFTFGANVSQLISTLVWSNSSTTNPTNVSPSLTTNYTATSSYLGCTITPLPALNVTVDILPTTPTATNSTECNVPVTPTASVTSTTGALGTHTFKWYSAATGGTLLQTSTSTTYTSTITQTTTFYVSEINGTCESGRVAVTATLPEITFYPTNKLICAAGESVDLTGPAGYSTYNWSGGTIIGSGQIVQAQPTVTTVYTLLATGPGCSATFNFNIGVIAGAGATPTAAVSNVCTNTSTTNLLSSNLSAGNFGVSTITHAPATAPGSAVTLATGGTASVALSGGSLDDGGWGGIPIGFNYNFFGNSYTNLGVGTNGLVMFGTIPGYSIFAGELGQYNFSAPAFPNAGNPLNVIGLMLSDMNFGTATSSLKYWTDGIAPTRRFVLSGVYAQWNGGALTTVQLHLYETTGIVEVHITSSASVLTRTVGLQNFDASIGALAPGWSGRTSTLTTPTAFRFTPPAVYTYNWVANDVFTSTNSTLSTNGLTDITSTVNGTAGTYNYKLTTLNPISNCSVESFVAFDVNPVPAAPTTSGATVVAGIAGTLSTSSGAATYNWYDVASGGTALQSSASTSYSASACSTTPFYVEKVVAGCASPRSTATLTITPLAITSSTGDTRCGVGPVSLTAAGNGGSIDWFTSPTGGLSVSSSNTYNIASISATTPYYVQTANGTVASGGKPSTDGADGTNTLGGIYFTANTAFTLDNVKMYPTGAGTNTIELYAGSVTSGTAIYSQNITFNGADPLGVVVNLGWNIPAGTYTIYQSVSGASCYRDASFGLSSPATSYPYNIGAAATLTQGTLTDYYYFFYDWNITVGCVSPRTTVTATVTAPPNLTLSTNSVNDCVTGAATVNGSVSITAGSTSFDTYVWTPAIGTITGTNTTPYIFDVPSTQSYTLTATQLTGLQCVNTATLNVELNSNPLTGTATLSTTSICQSPPATSINLTASGFGAVTGQILGQNFETGLGGWNVNGGSTPALADFQIGTHGTTGVGAGTINSPGGTKFILADPDGAGSGVTLNTRLVSPIFSLVGYSAATLTFKHYYRYLTNNTARLQISLNGGAWTTLQNYNADAGTRTGFATETVSLTPYIGQSNVRIRFNYTGGWEWYWAIDDISVDGVEPVLTYAWTGPNSFASATQNPSRTNIVLADAGVYQVTATNGSGCSTSGSTLSLTVNPIATLSGVTQTSTVCSGSPFSVSFVGTNPVGTTFTWTAPTISPSATGMSGYSAESNQATLSQTITNTSGIVKTVTYTVTPTTGTCVGVPFTLVVTVYPVILPPTLTTTTTTSASVVQASWSAVSSATSYNIEYSPVPDFSSTVVSFNNFVGTTVPFTGLTPYIYYFRVAAVNAVCGVSPWAAITPFATTAFTWDGDVNSSWNNGSNWSGGPTATSLPTATDNVIIFNRTSPNFNPTIFSADLNGVCQSAILNAGSVVTIQSGKELRVVSDLSSAGSGATITGAGVVNMDGTGAQSISGTNSISNLTINNNTNLPSGILSVSGIVTVATGKALSSNGNLKLLSTATSTAIISGSGSGNVTGNVEVNRYMPGVLGYRYVSSPITQATGLTTADFDVTLVGTNGLVWNPLVSIPSPFPNCWYYDETVDNYYSQYGWTAATPGPLRTGRGYALITPANHSASLVGPVNNGTFSASDPITRTGTFTGAGVNLAGNPYPSPISWSALLTANGGSGTNISPVVKRFSSLGQYYGQYVDWNGTVGTGGATDNIALGQAFFITKANNTTPYTVQYDNSIRRNFTNTTFYEAQDSQFNNLLRMQLVGGAGADEFVLYFDASATDNYDVNYDAIKFLSETAGIPNIYTNIDSLKLSINVLEKLNQDMIVPMGIVAKTAGNYQINVLEHASFAPTSMLYLEDRTLGIWSNLRTTDQYSVSLPVGEHNGRFFLHFRPAVEVSVANETCQQADGSVSVTNNSMEQQWNASLLNTQGELVAQSSGTSITFNNLSDGNYTLRLVDANGYSVEQPIAIEAGIVVEAVIAPLTSSHYYTSEVIEASVQTVVSGATYEWYLNGVLKGTGSNISMNVTEAGVYTLTLKMYGSSCVTQSNTTFSVTQESTVGIETANDASGFVVYPNPVRDVLNVKINDKIGFTTLSIHDALGKLIHTEVLNGATGEQVIQVNMNDYAAGLYQITLEGNKKKSVAKFSKTK